MKCTIRVAKTKALTAKLICVFVFAYADCWFFLGWLTYCHVLEQNTVNSQTSGFPRVREKSGENGILQKSGKCQGILMSVREISKIRQKSGKCQGILSRLSGNFHPLGSSFMCASFF